MDDAKMFVDELQRYVSVQLASLDLLKDDETEAGGKPEVIRRLKVALKNELEAAELAAFWIPSTPEVDVKLALARPAATGRCTIFSANSVRPLNVSPARTSRAKRWH